MPTPPTRLPCSAAGIHATPPSRARRRAYLYGLGALALALIYLGCRIALAGLADFQTRAFLADWENRRSPPSAKAWAVAHAAAERAVAHYPTAYGPYLERLGYVHAWQHHHAPFGAAHAQPSRAAARDAFRAAIAARSTWPYAWLALAETKLRLLEFDAEFHHALTQAHAHAPWRPDINRRLAELGFTAWPQLDTGPRQATHEAARRALKRLNAASATALFAQATTAGQRPALCRSLDEATRTRLARHCS